MIEARTAREWIVRLQDGEDVVEALKGLTVKSAALLAGIGMVRNAEMGYWNGDAYETHPHAEPSELVSLQGNLATDEQGDLIVHAHVCLAGRDGTVTGGHLLRATVHNTLELALLPLNDVALDRRREESGLVGLYPRVS
jgi:uncharacterized protein